MESRTASAFWVTGPGRGELRSENLPSPGGDQLRVRTLYSAISRGTESLVFSGQVPASEWQRMRAPFQSGDFPAPVKYGYSNVGVVEAGPTDWVGTEVFCLYPHQTAYLVPVSAAHRLPAGLPAARAVLAANVETALNGLWDAGVLAGDRVCVIGAGVVGCLVAWLAARVPGCEVQLIDVQRARAGIAAELGVPFATPGEAGGEADVVIHCSGTPAGLAQALQLAAFEARIVEMSWYGDRTVPLPLGAEFHSKRLRLRSSQVGHVATAQRARWSHRRRLELALRLLASAPELDALISGEDDFTALPQRMPQLCESAGTVLCHRIRY
jgi:hypothetical protein